MATIHSVNKWIITGHVYANGTVATSPLQSVFLVGRASAVLTFVGRLAGLTETEGRLCQ